MALMKISVKQIYFYLVSFITLLVILFTATTVVSTILQSFVFKTKPKYTYQPPVPYFGMPFVQPINQVYPPLMEEPIDGQSDQTIQVLKQLKSEEGGLPSKQKVALGRWFADYDRWKADQEDQKKAELNGLIGNIVALLVFSPVFAYHFLEARKSK